MFVCNECGSEKVEMQVWVNANTFEPSQRTLIRIGNSGNYCVDCKKNVTFALKHQYEKKESCTHPKDSLVEYVKSKTAYCKECNTNISINGDSSKKD